MMYPCGTPEQFHRDTGGFETMESVFKKNECMYPVRPEPKLKRGFKDLLLEAVDETLSSLGEKPEQMFYSHLEDHFQIEREDIPDRIEEFAEAVEKIFGCGAKLIEIKIMESLYGKMEGESFEYSPEDGDLQFVTYIQAMKYIYRRGYVISRLR
jgi:hypothetical protein